MNDYQKPACLTVENFNRLSFAARLGYDFNVPLSCVKRTLTWADGSSVTITTAAEALTAIHAPQCDEITCAELVELILESLHDGAIKPAAGVIRKKRTAEEMTALLADPNLPTDIRREFELALGLPLTPLPPPEPRWPEMYNLDGSPVARSQLASLSQDALGITTIVVGADGLRLSRLVTPSGEDCPLPSAVFGPGAEIKVPYRLPPKYRVQAVGEVIRNGQVVRD